jgi:CBS domain-containing protein
MADLGMRVGDFMSRQVVTIDVSEHLDVAAEMMRLRRLRHLPVTSRGRLVGILTQHDLLHASSSSVSTLRPDAERGRMAQVAVADVMVADVLTIEPSAPVRLAAETMLLKKIGCLPVLDQGEIVGLISETDCMRLLTALLAMRDDSTRRPRRGGVQG